MVDILGTRVRYWQKCIQCEKVFYPIAFVYRCTSCNGLLMVERDEDYINRFIGTGEMAQRYFNNRRYGEYRGTYPYGSGVFSWLEHILPGFPAELAVSMHEGFTDLFEIPNWLKKGVGLNNLFIKMEGKSPTGSFKDRGLAPAISEARRLQEQYPELGVKFAVCASTGDTSAAAAAYCAHIRDKLGCVVLVPHERISPEQLSQALFAQAKVISIKHPDGFDACMAFVEEFCGRHPEMVLVNSENAFRIVGQETIALEICQDLHWKAPDWIAIPCGNGGNLTALLTSLLRMYERGLIDRMPGVIVAQTETANTLVRWARSGFRDYKPGVAGDSIASAMNIQDPVSFKRIASLRCKVEMKYYDVAEDVIEPTRAMFMSTGADICPQSAVALNAVLQAKSDGTIQENDVVVSISTASGLKFVQSGIKFHMGEGEERLMNPPIVVEGNIESIDEAVASVLSRGEYLLQP